MKKAKNVFLVVTGMLIAFILCCIFVFLKCNDRIKAGYLASEGEAAENFAVLTASNIHLTDKQVETLKGYTYAELMKSEENRKLKAMMSNESFATKVDYAYLMIHLKDSEAKYEVNEDNNKRFKAELGTKLDIMWLLDVTVSNEATESSTNDITDELTRYSYYIPEDDKILTDKATYIYNASEWGDHICGYAPVYSEEGNYIGAIGVELQTKDYDSYCGSAMQALGILMVVTLLLLTLVFFYIYRQYKLMQYEKIYTDALTKLGNRTYFNDRFIKYLNKNMKKDELFVLMIADIDWFKKVNDTFGHEIGDAVLIEVSEELLSLFGKDHTVRFGGEEFVVGLWVKSEDEIREKLEKLFKQIAKRRFSTQELTISLSMGCSYYKADELNGWLTSGMLRAADIMLYECKENGRKQYRIDEFDPKKKYEKEEKN